MSNIAEHGNGDRSRSSTDLGGRRIADLDDSATTSRAHYNSSEHAQRLNPEKLRALNSFFPDIFSEDYPSFAIDRWLGEIDDLSDGRVDSIDLEALIGAVDAVRHRTKAITGLLESDYGTVRQTPPVEENRASTTIAPHRPPLILDLFADQPLLAEWCERLSLQIDEALGEDDLESITENFLSRITLLEDITTKSNENEELFPPQIPSSPFQQPSTASGPELSSSRTQRGADSTDSVFSSSNDAASLRKGTLPITTNEFRDSIGNRTKDPLSIDTTDNTSVLIPYSRERYLHDNGRRIEVHSGGDLPLTTSLVDLTSALPTLSQIISASQRTTEDALQHAPVLTTVTEDDEVTTMSASSANIDDSHQESTKDVTNGTQTHQVRPTIDQERLINPAEYFRSLELLAKSVYSHSALCFHNEHNLGLQSSMPFPQFDILEVAESAMFDFFEKANVVTTAETGRAWLQHLYCARNVVFAAYLNLVRLQTEGYCGDYISALVLDRKRPDHVAKLVRLSVRKVKYLAKAFDDATKETKGGQYPQCRVLRNRCWHILMLFGVLPSESSSENSATDAYMWYTVAYVLDMAVLSYSVAHIEDFSTTQHGAISESFQLPNQFISSEQFHERADSQNDPLPMWYLRRRSLRCLEAFLHQDVWVFHTSADRQRHGKLYLQTDINTFADIWGPLWVSSLRSDPDEIYEIKVGNGSILAWPMDVLQQEHVLPAAGEIFCHWLPWVDSWTDVEFLQRRLPRRHLHWHDKLLIGAPPCNILELTQNKHCRRSIPHVKQHLMNIHALSHLRTARRDRVKDSQTIAVTAGGLGLTAGCTKTYKRQGGQTWKESIVEAWRDLDL